jgi:hypothetical protein
MAYLVGLTPFNSKSELDPWQLPNLGQEKQSRIKIVSESRRTGSNTVLMSQ